MLGSCGSVQHRRPRSLFSRGVQSGRCAWPVVMIGLLLAGVLPARAVELTRAQQAQILREAEDVFDHAMQVRRTDSSAAAAAYRAAAEKLQLLVDAGVRNGKLYYNLGNACLEGGELGRAIANYRRAQRLTPNDGRLEHNLRYARSLRRNQIESSGQRAFLHTLFFWHYGTSLPWRFGVGLGMYVAFWALMIARTFGRRIRWRYALVPVLVLWLALGVSVAVDALGTARQPAGVLVQDDIVVRKGNGEGFAPQFKQKLHEGVEFLVRERHRNWMRIELPDGKSGWIRADQAELI